MKSGLEYANEIAIDLRNRKLVKLPDIPTTVKQMRKYNTNF